jgi:hypothetical protein
LVSSQLAFKRRIAKLAIGVRPVRRRRCISTQLSLWRVLPLLIDQDCLLPRAWRLVGAVNATHPAAGSLLPLQQFLTGSLNAALTRSWLFRVLDPADEFIPPERRQAFPQRKDFAIGSNGCLKVITCFMDSAMGKSVCHETSKHCHPTAEFINAAWKGGFRAWPLDNGMSTIGSTPARQASRRTRIVAPFALPC